MKPRSRIGRERGLVLFVALIAMVVLSLAAVALIRSVDTATIIAGNLAFKQATTNSGEGGLVEANRWLAAQIGADGVTLSATLLGTSAADVAAGVAAGYYATTTGLATKNGYAAALSSYQMLTNANTWQNDRSAEARVASCDADGNPSAPPYVGNTDCSGNQIRYVVERMCTTTGAANPGTCLFGPITDSTSSFGVKDATKAETPTTSGGAPIYRITARVIGPKNSVSYIQTFVY